ncbi:polyprenyl diphosphate synthase [Lentisphaera profundi]|uniref:Isoprenyl transferase n=1 Tax=Lentisphaera profundi TaxID=1658616 RepID=A0ABY7W1M9_9BACT|nr:polyprenyl diphosphate synthase [Lentisphaera profundi]WDE99479.1 polyprenyl diphosphate synthase [Lentisphaera profundi]
MELSVPKHIAIIMDGNGRWAAERGLDRIQGHTEGVSAVLRTVDACLQKGVKYLTLYTFSTENWKRSEEEVSALMMLLGEALSKYLPDFMEKGIKLTTIGDVAALPKSVYAKLEDVRIKTQDNDQIVFNLALNYGGRDELVRTCRRVIDAGLKADELTEEVFESHLDSAGMPDPELLIRTSGEMRLSNFLLWQVSYSEFVCIPEFWPEFGPELLEKALVDFNNRERRFGGR